jgi:replicative DNA helicase
MLAGPPGVGKTALALVWLTEALTMNPGLSCLIANIEMEALQLVHKIVAWNAQIDLTSLQENVVLPRHTDRLDSALDALAKIGDRLIFAEPPFEFGRILNEVENTGARIACFDYIQRVSVDPSVIPHHDERTRLEGLMSACRDLARTDRCVLILSAVGRSRDGRGQVSYGGHLNYANLRGSSELEFASDDVVVLVPVNDQHRNADTWTLKLKHEKCRHGPTRDKTLLFHRSVQTFVEAPSAGAAPKLDDDLRQDLQDENF